MQITVTELMFIEAFKNSQYKHNFSETGLKALFAHLEQREAEGVEVKFDLSIICSEFAEDEADEIMSNYSVYLRDVEDLDDDELAEAIAKECNDYGLGIVLDNGSVLYSPW